MCHVRACAVTVRCRARTDRYAGARSPVSRSRRAPITSPSTGRALRELARVAEHPCRVGVRDGVVGMSGDAVGYGHVRSLGRAPAPVRQGGPEPSRRGEAALGSENTAWNCSGLKQTSQSGSDHRVPTMAFGAPTAAAGAAAVTRECWGMIGPGRTRAHELSVDKLRRRPTSLPTRGNRRRTAHSARSPAVLARQRGRNPIPTPRDSIDP